jgi:hypothetical protein
MKAYAGSRSIAPNSIHPNHRYWVQVSCQLHVPAALPPWNDVWVSPESVWTFLRKQNLLLQTALPCVTGCTTHPQVSLLPTASLHWRLVCAWLMITAGGRGYEFNCTCYKLATSWRCAFSTVDRVGPTTVTKVEKNKVFARKVNHSPTVRL